MKLKILAIFKLTLILLLIVQPTFAETTSSNSQDPAITFGGNQDLNFSLTISGGISLGSYEAGVNWGLIDYMRRMRTAKINGKEPKLKAVTGASAGAINAVMSAMLWCIDDEEVPTLEENGLQGKIAVDRNMIRDAWAQVGIDELLPKDESQYCNPKTECPYPDTPKTAPDTKLIDEMFARRAFEPSVVMIRKMLELSVFKKNQKVKIAILATREDPIDIIHGDIKVKSQRHVFILQFITDESGRGHFESKNVDDKIDRNIGTIAYLPEKVKLADGEGTGVATDDVIRLMFASSAFPVTFGKVKLSYCTSSRAGSKEARGMCPGGTFMDSADFIDGGVFENVPLGAARALLGNEARNNNFFFISPSTRRNVPEPFKDPLWVKPKTFGIEGILGFVPGFIDSASDHELDAVLGTGDWKSYNCYDASDIDKCKNFDNKLVVTKRYLPITGAYLGHFGAFLDKPFREFDYYAGVYDIINDLANFVYYIKTGEISKTVPGNEAKKIYDEFEIKKGSPASAVFSLIATQEHKEYLDPADEGGWHWINDQLPDPTDKPNTMRTIFNSIIQTTKSPVTEDDDFEVFNNFISRLHANRYTETGEHSDEMNWIAKKYDRDFTVWFAPLVGRAGKRLQQLQSFESNDNKKNGLRYLVIAASLGMGRYFNDDDTVSFQPTSVPQNEQRRKKKLYNLIPYELSTDTANGGASISYLAQLMLPIRSLSLDLKITPVGYNKFGDRHVLFSQADLYLSFNRYKDMFSFGAGPTISYLWQQATEYHTANAGVAVFLDFFKTLRLTVGLRSISADNLFGPNYYLTLGIVDIPGIVNRVVNGW